MKHDLHGIIPSKLSTRVIAHLVDLIITSVAFSPVYLLVSSLISSLPPFLLTILVSSYLILLILYFVIFEGISSTSPGKRLLGLYVISLDDMTEIGFRKAFARNVMRLSDMATLYLVTLFSRAGMRIGDIAANTIVVSRELLSLEVPRGNDPISRDVRSGIEISLLALTEEKLSITSKDAKEKLIKYIERYEDLPSYRRIYEELEEFESTEEARRIAAAMIVNPPLGSKLLGIQDLIEIYERASRLCYYIESRDLLKKRANLMKGLINIKSRSPRVSELISVFREAPTEFRRIIPYFAISLVIFLISAAIAYVERPIWVKELIRELFGRGSGELSISQTLLLLIILLNNVRVALSLVGTSPLIFMPFLVLVANGALVGVAITLSQRPEIQTLMYLLPHGVPELTAIFITSSIAMWLVKEMISPTDGDRYSSLRKVVMSSLDLMVLTILLLMYAAVVESFVTARIAEHIPTALAFSITEGIVIYTYLLLLGTKKKD